jgi:cytochrome c oxidase subunit 3
MTADQPHEPHGDDSHGHTEHGHGEHSPFIQHHYDDAQHQFDSGKLGIWLFLAQEVLFFSALFVAYVLYRYHHPEIYSYAHKYLDVMYGAINTAVLIVSSLTAAWAVRCAQLNQRRGLIFCLAATIVCACGFLGIKYIEYSHKVHEHILFGRYFDPCVSSGGYPLLTKNNNCPGTKSTVVWDVGSATATAGCFDEIDQDRRTSGVQAECTVKEFDLKDQPGRPEKLETFRRDITTKCPPPSLDHDADAGHGASPPPPTVEDLLADREQELELGKALIQPRRQLTPHDLKVQEQMGPPPENTNMFFTIYFAMTGLHGIHVLFGVAVFTWLLIRAIKGQFTPEYFGPVDYAALYWHIVDLIWIFLFPLLYLIH